VYLRLFAIVFDIITNIGYLILTQCDTSILRLIPLEYLVRLFGHTFLNGLLLLLHWNKIIIMAFIAIIIIANRIVVATWFGLIFFIFQSLIFNLVLLTYLALTTAAKLIIIHNTKPMRAHTG